MSFTVWSKTEPFKLSAVQESLITLEHDNKRLLLTYREESKTWDIDLNGFQDMDVNEILQLAFLSIFYVFPTLRTEVVLQWANIESQKGTLSLPVEYNELEGNVSIDRMSFWQIPSPWMYTRCSDWPLSYLPNQVIRRPKCPKPGSTLYERFIPSLNETLSFVSLDIEQHLQYFHEWQNKPRVEYFWNESGSWDQHHEYLTTLQNDPHSFGVIGCFNDVPFAYFEVYWVPEDRIAPFAQPWHTHDRGFHALVGNDKFRGPHRVPVWLSSITHMLFLDDPRTQRVLLEPRIDNSKFINYLIEENYSKRLEFNFPHKRAAFMEITRNMFFSCLGPRI
ncbi:siderophore-iron biosynthesis protein Sib3 [Schizosaccharomyces pombe]|uniref:Putative lysine N-acyltransferase C17G9.06c n=1 Tax=Schizosaccharomyces pombe (strain 972 / ATCC 24843) TaxID=284812 RepID=YNZ6_SCHPO|nr:putative siderophore-iron biosynthesis protein [Schizosaccharomyces pombe]Q9UUE3.1 RecName: Full=Putative lysine N-acyltransferase C17G9.06c [Schizosaccharomyces pombe 972h-]CAB52804.1 siderophore-iron biosynthesis protein (predicted) [Schizosaccharomyces pombe]|eukprot:NP_595895.1 putative siderophore-iron biosynthesis protein [Schizosaccharomyces pombe]